MAVRFIIYVIHIDVYKFINCVMNKIETILLCMSNIPDKILLSIHSLCIILNYNCEKKRKFLKLLSLDYFYEITIAEIIHI